MSATELVELRRLLVLMRIDHKLGDRAQVEKAIEQAIAVIDGIGK
jgi:hypothetical protein